jgi:hypothetical protein
MLNKKGQILDFIKIKPRRWKEIVSEFGQSGDVAAALYVLQHDGLIFKPERGIYEVVPTGKKARKRI